MSTAVENRPTSEDQAEEGPAPKHLTGIQKAAVFLISTGVDRASRILQQLNNNEVESITKAISEMKNVSSSVVNLVNEEFYTMMNEKKILLEGGQDYAKDLVIHAKGRSHADALFRKLESEKGQDAFSIIHNSATANIVNFITSEHPQIAAVILAHLKLEKSAEILSQLPHEFRADIAMRMAKLGKISGGVVEELSSVIKDQLSDYAELNYINKGSSAVAGILNEADIATERQMLEEIGKIDSELAQEIKDQMFLFEDILELDDRTVQAIITKLNQQDMVVGLKGVEPAIKRKFFSNMSSRMRDVMEEDLEAMGGVHLKQVEEAQQNILTTVKDLDREGKISLRSKDLIK
ncbi:MAG: flagellar motor switch protein FliG [Balneolales bacterium]